MRAALPALLAGLLAGCESLPGVSMPAMTLPDLSFLRPAPSGEAEAPAPIAAAAVEPAPRGSDPLAAFAASATPGATGVVEGQPARLLRVYHAASGRECREVLLGTGMSQRAAVACRQPDGSFASSRPLLQGGRP
ncbi:MAG: hypothetical protein ACK44F_00260 [Roseococcus sp.]